MNLSALHKVYFIGIGGIGMSALARYFMHHGCSVAGYDRTPGDITSALIAAGADIHFTDNPELVPGDTELVIYTPAIPADHSELTYLRDAGYPIRKRSEILGIITDTTYTIAVAGTHGKTTISAMTAWLLQACGHPASAFLGGIANNWQSNFVPAGTDRVVVEADEYDRSFLRLYPDIAVVSAMDADHLDIYGDAVTMEEGFLAFCQQIKPGGTLIARYDLPVVPHMETIRNVITYGLQDAADLSAQNIRVEEGTFRFDVRWQGQQIIGFELPFPGFHNVENALAAMAVGLIQGCSWADMKEALRSFTGIRRRMEIAYRSADRVIIDDYAHHPKELEALIRSAKALFPAKKVSIVFQPHLYSRTRDLADGFAAALSLADQVYLLPVYPARELPITGVESNLIQEKMTGKSVDIIQKSDLVDTVLSTQWEVLLMAGAGDIDRLVAPLVNTLQSEKP